MRATEFIIENNLYHPVDQYKMYEEDETELDEMAGEIHGGVRKALMDKGYKYLGSGIDKQAWLEPSTGQVLIIFGYRKGIKDFSPDQRMFIDWINYCNKNANNPNLPKFSGFESFEFQGKKYIQARMEPLKELPAKIGEIVNYVDVAQEKYQNYIGYGDMDKVFDELARRSYYDKETDTFSSPGLTRIIEFLGGPEKAKNLLTTVHTVTQFGKKHGFNIDLHRGNYMARPDGTIVVNDPFALVFE